MEETGGPTMEVLNLRDIGAIGIRETCVEEEKRSMSNLNYECLEMLIWVNIVEMGTS